MAKQLLLNRGFENELANFYTQGTVLTSDIAHSGEKSALLLATPTAIAELSQVLMLIMPGTKLAFSFRARQFRSEDVQSVSNVRAEVNFISLLGTVIPPGKIISIRGRDLPKNRWNVYDGYAEAPFGTLAVQLVIRLEPPASGTSGLLVDDLALVAEEVTTGPQLQAPLVAPSNQSFLTFPGTPGVPFPNSPLPNTTPQTPGMPFPGWPWPNTHHKHRECRSPAHRYLTRYRSPRECLSPAGPSST